MTSETNIPEYDNQYPLHIAASEGAEITKLLGKKTPEKPDYEEASNIQDYLRSQEYISHVQYSLGTYQAGSRFGDHLKKCGEILLRATPPDSLPKSWDEIRSYWITSLPESSKSCVNNLSW